MKFLDDALISGLLPAETGSFPSPVPTQIVSSDEYLPVPQTAQQKQVEARLIEMSDRLAKGQGLSRRRFFQTAAGMATSFVAMNEVFGRYFAASEAEAATPELAEQLAAANAGQLIFDGHTHFLRDDTRLSGFVKGREAIGQWGWNKELAGKEQTLNDLKFNNYVKEILFGQRYQDYDPDQFALGRGAGLVHPAGPGVQDPHCRQCEGRHAPHAGAFHDHPWMGRLARQGRRGDRKVQTRFLEGLLGRRQYPQGA
jgi:hypothetical protein